MNAYSTWITGMNAYFTQEKQVKKNRIIKAALALAIAIGTQDSPGRD